MKSLWDLLEAQSSYIPDPQSYIPIGCIGLPNSISQPDDSHSRDVLQLTSDIISLGAASWLTVSALGNQSDNLSIWRISILPFDVAYSRVDRSSKRLQNSLTNVLRNIDTTPSKWEHGESMERIRPFDLYATADRSSLYYMFNTIPSPAPRLSVVSDQYQRFAMTKLLHQNSKLRGLLTSLYPYQRRSAAMMLQREIAPGMELDPRLELRTGPTGENYYFGARDKSFYAHTRMYDNIQGGILAETMGLGKTLICIALIMATKNHLPAIPPQYTAVNSCQPGVHSLAQIAARTLVERNVPWRVLLEDISVTQEEEFSNCAKLLEDQSTEYVIPSPRIRPNRSNSRWEPEKLMRRCAGTIIVVPRNLVHQWRSELAKHLEEGALTILVMDSPQSILPSVPELVNYDIILFSRARFELEKRENDFDVSPLSSIHWLRMIVDEGHGFSSFSTSTNAAYVAEKLVKAERRWIVSGTPAKDLLGVEVELQALTSSQDSKALKSYRDHALKNRKQYDKQQELSSGAISAIGALASKFLQVQPWTSAIKDGTEKSANWDDYVYRHDDQRNRTYSSFSTCLKRILTGLVVKTQPQDIERDLILPELTHKIIRLEPSIFDKMTANLFVLLFTANAITSERSDQDYLFHRASTAHLHRLIANLRQSTFSWTAFDESSVGNSIETAEKYLAKQETSCTDQDRHLMRNTINTARLALKSPLWDALSRTHEIGIVTENWPTESQVTWAFESYKDSMVTGLSLAISAQRFINDRLSSSDPTNGFADAGIHAQILVHTESQADQNHNKKTENVQITGVPAVGLQSEFMGLKRLTISGVGRSLPKKRLNMSDPSDDTNSLKPSISKAKKAKKTKRRNLSFGATNIDISPDSTLGHTHVIGTTSSKLTYLIDRISSIDQNEKILIFYDGGNIAYYLSQALDLFNIKHLIYANTLSGEQRSKYIVLFNSDPNQRVLIMDIRQAAHGLNLSSASRVFFINPPCRPDVEAQAIKRAHRIGQTRPVHVETLVLKGTIEEAMHDRAAKMTNHEHLIAKNIEEDEGIRGIIQAARVLHLNENDLREKKGISLLKSSQQLFGRPNRATKNTSGLEKELFGGKDWQFEADDMVSTRRSKRRKEAKQNRSPIDVVATEDPFFEIASPGLASITSPNIVENVHQVETSMFGGA